MCPVAANILEVASSVRDHPMPGEQHVVGERCSEGAIEIDRHLGDSLLGRLHAPLIGTKTELPPDRGLHARTVEDFALDLRGSEGFGTESLDHELVPIVRTEVREGANEHATAKQNLPLPLSSEDWDSTKIPAIQVVAIATA